MADEDDLVQLIDDSGEVAPGPPRPWAIAVIDDDPAVHEGTRFALYDYTLHGQGLEIVAARVCGTPVSDHRPLVVEAV